MNLSLLDKLLKSSWEDRWRQFHIADTSPSTLGALEEGTKDRISLKASHVSSE